MYPKPSTSHHSAAIIVPWRKPPENPSSRSTTAVIELTSKYIAHVWLQPDRAIVRSAAIVYLENHPPKSQRNPQKASSPPCV